MSLPSMREDNKRAGQPLVKHSADITTKAMPRDGNNKSSLGDTPGHNAKSSALHTYQQNVQVFYF